MLFCQKIHIILLINALLSQNLVIKIYALFPPIFLRWQIVSAIFFAFWMYGFNILGTDTHGAPSPYPLYVDSSFDCWVMDPTLRTIFINKRVANAGAWQFEEPFWETGLWAPQFATIMIFWLIFIMWQLEEPFLVTGLFGPVSSSTVWWKPL